MLLDSKPVKTNEQYLAELQDAKSRNLELHSTPYSYLKILIEKREIQSRKALSPMPFTLSGIVTEVSAVHSSKALAPMFGTPLEIITSFIPKPHGTIVPE